MIQDKVLEVIIKDSIKKSLIQILKLYILSKADKQ